jgi:hypothetical protein
MSPEKAALINALIPCFLGVVTMVIGFFMPKTIDSPADQPDAKPSEPNKTRRYMLWGGPILIFVGLARVAAVSKEAPLRR